MLRKCVRRQASSTKRSKTSLLSHVLLIGRPPRVPTGILNDQNATAQDIAAGGKNSVKNQYGVSNPYAIAGGTPPPATPAPATKALDTAALMDKIKRIEAISLKVLGATRGGVPCQSRSYNARLDRTYEATRRNGFCQARSVLIGLDGRRRRGARHGTADGGSSTERGNTSGAPGSPSARRRAPRGGGRSAARRLLPSRAKEPLGGSAPCERQGGSLRGAGAASRLLPASVRRPCRIMRA